MENIDQQLVTKVLESLSLNMKSESMIKEIANIERQIQILINERNKIESDKRTFISAQEAVGRYSQIARSSSEEVKKKMVEINLIAEKAVDANREAAKFAAIVQKEHNFDEKIAEVNTILSEANEIKKDRVKDLNEIKMLREELKKQGVDIDLNKKPPTNISM